MAPHTTPINWTAQLHGRTFKIWVPDLLPDPELAGLFDGVLLRLLELLEAAAINWLGDRMDFKGGWCYERMTFLVGRLSVIEDNLDDFEHVICVWVVVGHLRHLSGMSVIVFIFVGILMLLEKSIVIVINWILLLLFMSIF